MLASGDGPLRLYTMANDRMAEYFERFLLYRDTFLPDVTLRVIPFDDKIQKIQSLIANRSDVVICDPDSSVDNIGKKIFLEEEYRPEIAAWRYFRKLNAFVGHADPFVFLDVNSILLGDPRDFLRIDQLDDQKIIFRTVSSPLRTIKLPEAQAYYNILDDGIGAGFNCAFFSARGNFLDLDLAKAIASRRLRHVIGKSPEQGFLAIYIAYFSKTARLVSSESSELGAQQKADSKLEFDGLKYLRFVDGKDRGKVCLTLKQTGQDLKGLPELIEQFRIRRGNA